MLEFDDIQYILITRVPALTGRYEFLSFREPAQARTWLEAIREKVPSAKAVAGRQAKRAERKRAAAEKAAAEK